MGSVNVNYETSKDFWAQLWNSFIERLMSENHPLVSEHDLFSLRYTDLDDNYLIYSIKNAKWPYMKYQFDFTGGILGKSPHMASVRLVIENQDQNAALEQYLEVKQKIQNRFDRETRREFTWSSDNEIAETIGVFKEINDVFVADSAQWEETFDLFIKNMNDLYFGTIDFLHEHPIYPQSNGFHFVTQREYEKLNKLNLEELLEQVPEFSLDSALSRMKKNYNEEFGSIDISEMDIITKRKILRKLSAIGEKEKNIILNQIMLDTKLSYFNWGNLRNLMKSVGAKMVSKAAVTELGVFLERFARELIQKNPDKFPPKIKEKEKIEEKVAKEILIKTIQKKSEQGNLIFAKQTDDFLREIGEVSKEELKTNYTSIDNGNSEKKRRLIVENDYERSSIVKSQALDRAQGVCELCGQYSFEGIDMKSFLVVHHIIELSRGGEDSIKNVAAICPQCHARIHYGIDGNILNAKLGKKINNYYQ